ncbi:MAG TPA: PfkB family carbohydrate kinase [Anaerolineae bacterium]
MEKIDYLVIGHVSCDITPTGWLVGGTAAYSGRTAQALGCRTAVLTSTAVDYEGIQQLPGLTLRQIPAEATTTFENIYTPGGRQQIIHAVAERLTAEHVPSGWERSRIVQLAPIANEVAPEMIYLFSNSVLGLTPQGWLRRWDEKGRVYATDWSAAATILPLATAVILSQEDLLNDAMLEQYRQWARLLVLTQGNKGCTVFCGDEVRQVPAFHVEEVEPTGAGDIFAAAFLIRLHQTAGNPWEAARFANYVAAQSVTQLGLPAKIQKIEAEIENYTGP